MYRTETRLLNNLSSFGEFVRQNRYSTTTPRFKFHAFWWQSMLGVRSYCKTCLLLTFLTLYSNPFYALLSRIEYNYSYCLAIRFFFYTAFSIDTDESNTCTNAGRFTIFYLRIMFAITFPLLNSFKGSVDYSISL